MNEDGWMDGKMDGRIDGWMDGWMNGLCVLSHVRLLCDTGRP